MVFDSALGLSKQSSLGASSWYKSLSSTIFGTLCALALAMPFSCGEAVLMLSKYSVPHSVRFWKSLAVCGSALVIAVLVYQPARIEGNSMAPLLSDHELIFINRLVYHFEPVQRGDVVVFLYPEDRTKSFIKRIVALPGETVEIRQGLVYIDGVWLPELYVPSQFEDLSDLCPLLVPRQLYFLIRHHHH